MSTKIVLKLSNENLAQSKIKKDKEIANTIKHFIDTCIYCPKSMEILNLKIIITIKR